MSELPRSRVRGAGLAIGNVPEDVVEDVEAAGFGHQGESLGEFQRVGTVIYDQHACDEDDETVSIARRLCIPCVYFMLNFLKRQALSHHISPGVSVSVLLRPPSACRMSAQLTASFSTMAVAPCSCVPSNVSMEFPLYTTGSSNKVSHPFPLRLAS